MAKSKKAAKDLTLEERLEQILVPVEKQPYAVPKNWCWIHLLDSFENHTDSKKKVPRKSYLEDGKIAVVDQGLELVGGYTNDESLKQRSSGKSRIKGHSKQTIFSGGFKSKYKHNT